MRLAFLLLAQLETVADDFSFAVAAVLTGGEVALLDGALVRKAAGAFEKQLHAFATAKTADRSGITCHVGLSSGAGVDRFTRRGNLGVAAEGVSSRSLFEKH